jgi:hypothetical protein
MDKEEKQGRFLYMLGKLDLMEETKPHPATPEWKADYESIRSEFTQQARWYGHAIMRS